MESGMTAIAAVISSQPSIDDHSRALTRTLEQQTLAIQERREEPRRFQQLQLTLLQRLVDKDQ
ncbi:hypothetical protein PI124_g20084 [Phytophthora idaei]|nr:hypothetical protein PI126_g19998 [Phytophthora idaei]KAG3234873.1 hypothetical protein PI124_g20084 [Phytophthora idaei]